MITHSEEKKRQEYFDSSINFLRVTDEVEKFLTNFTKSLANLGVDLGCKVTVFKLKGISEL